MKIIVDKHTVTINKNEIVNEGEYNVQACNFQFSSEYDGLPKIAIFKTDTVTKQILLSGDSCITPSEVLESTGIVGLGVYAYENDGDNLILRYSPTPAVFTVEPGSYDEGDAPTPPTPSEIEQLQAQITENANNISSLQDVTSTHTTQIETLQTDVNNIKAEQITQNQNIQTNTNNIQTNTSDIENIKSEQITQNQNISQNTNDITDIKSEQVTQNTNIQNNTNNISTLQTGLSSEITNRQNADINLQSQIDAITSSSDVVDIVGTYAQLQSYDTQHLQNNDVIKVLQDETHDNAMTYYRWLKNTSTWQYIGQEGPYYTKSETDMLLQSKANVNDVYSKSQIDTKLEDYALKSDLTDFVTEQDVDTKLEDYVETTTYAQGQATQDANIEENATNINWLQTLVNQMPTVSGQGTDLSLQDVLNYRLMKFLPQGVSSQFSTEGKNLFNGNDVTTSNTTNWSVTFNDNKLTITHKNSYNTGSPKIEFGILPSGTYVLSGTLGSNIGLAKNDTYVTNLSSGSSFSCDGTETIKFTFPVASFPSGTTLNYENMQLELGSTATSYEPYTDGPAPNPSYPYPVKSVTGENSVVIDNINLFNNIFERGQYYGEGVWQTSTNRCTTDFIKVTPNMTYNFNLNSSNNVCSLININGFDINKNWLGARALFDLDVFGVTDRNKSFTVPANVEFVRVTLRAYNGTNADITIEQAQAELSMLTKGSTIPSEYVPYEEQIKTLSLGNIELNSSPGGTIRDQIVGSPNNWVKREYMKKIVLTGQEAFNVHTTTETYIRAKTTGTVFEGLIEGGLSYCNYFQNDDTPGGISVINTFRIADYGSGVNRRSQLWVCLDINEFGQLSDFTSWLQTKYANNTPMTVYAPLIEPIDIPITDTTLINQLNDIYYNAHSYNGVTNITTTYADGNEQMYLDIEALKNVWSEV